MSFPAKIAVIMLLTLIEIHTVSFALWNWKHRNRFGAVMVFILCLISIALPLYMIFFQNFT